MNDFDQRSGAQRNGLQRNGAGARRQADLFLADLLGTRPPRRRRLAAATIPSPSSPWPPPSAARPIPPAGGAGRLFDRLVHAGAASAAIDGEGLDAAYEPVALPGSVTPASDLRTDDLV